jgi:hypothetical protein
MTAPATTHRPAGHGLLHSHSTLPSAASLPPDRRGRLRNSARPGDFLAAPRCGAHTRAGGCCRQPAMGNGRCRLHGGLSTGPRTAEGRVRCARARRIHGFYSAEMVALRRAATAHCRRMDAFFAGLKVRRTAGHGLLRSEIGSRKPEARVAERRLQPSRSVNPHSVRPADALLASGFCVLTSGSTAGHGVLRSFSVSRPSPRAAHLLAGTCLRAPLSAGHGVHRSLSPAGPVPAGMLVQPTP